MKNKKLLFFLPAVTVPAIIIFIFYYLHFKYSLNVPVMDDYDAVIYFLSSFIDSNTFSEKFMWLITQHREHRYLFPRIVFLIYYFILGEINFKVILFLGLSALAGIYAIILKSINFANEPGLNAKKVLLIISVTFLFFNLQYWEGSTWAIAAFFFYFGMLFSLLSIYFLSKNKKHTVFYSLLFAVLAVSTSGNGLFVFIIGAIILFSQNGFSKKLYLWIACGALVYILYFFKYVSPTDQTPVSEIILHKPFKLALFYLSYLGSIFRQIPRYGYAASLIAGAIFLLISFFLMVKKYYRINPVNSGFILFLFLTMFASSLGRVDVGFISRYTVFSTLLFICISISFYEIYFDRIRPMYLQVFLFFSIIFNLYSYNFNFGDMVRMKDILTNGAILGKAGDYSLLVYPDSASVKKLYNMGVRKNIYNLPDFSYEDFLSNDINVSSGVADEVSSVEYNNFVDTADYIYINGWIDSGNKKFSKDSKIYLILKSGNNTFTFKTNAIRRKEFKTANLPNAENKATFSFVMLKKGMNFPPGDYKVNYFIDWMDGTKNFINSDKSILVK